MTDKAIRAGKLIALLEDSFWQTYVSQLLSVSNSTIQRTCQRYKKPGSERK